MNNDKVVKLTKRMKRLEDKITLLHKQIAGTTEFSQILPELAPVEVIDKGASTTVISFAGMMLQPGLARKEFSAAMSDFDCNLIYVKDFDQLWYQSGLLGLTKGHQDTADYLKKLLPLTTKNLITMGASSGGYAALLFGVLLKAESTISFSPQVFLDRTTFRHFRPNDLRVSNVNEFRFRELSSIIGDSPDVKHYVYVGELNDVDMLHTNKIKKIPNVNVTNLDTAAHNVAGYMKKNGTLTDRLKELIGYC